MRQDVSPAACDPEPPHHRGFFATRAGQWLSTYIDRGSRRFVSVPFGRSRRFFAAGLFVYGADARTHVALVAADGARKRFRRVFVKSHFPYLTLNPGQGGYKSLNLTAGFLRRDVSHTMQIESGQQGQHFPVCRIVPVVERDELVDMDEVGARIDAMIADPTSCNTDALPKLERSLVTMKGKADEHKRNQRLIQLYCLNGVNHRTAHKLLKDWVARERETDHENAVADFQEQLRQITFPLALGRHGYNPSFLNLDLEQVEAELATLLEQVSTFGVQPFLNSGTLLGYYRDGQPIPHDDDFDIGILVAGETEEAVAKSWRDFVQQANEHFTTIDKGSFLAVKLSNGVQVDMFAAWVNNRELFVHPYCWADISADALMPMGNLTVRGRDFPIPADPDAVLSVNYGDNWRVPDPFWRFDYKKSKRRFGKMLKKLKG